MHVEGILQYKFNHVSSPHGRKGWRKRSTRWFWNAPDGAAPSASPHVRWPKLTPMDTSYWQEIGKCTLYSWQLSVLYNLGVLLLWEEDGVLSKVAFDKTSRNKELQHLILRRELFLALAQRINSLTWTKHFNPFFVCVGLSFKCEN